MNREIQSLRNLRQSLDGDLVFRAFHISDVVPGEISFFGELFLGKTGLHSLGANYFAEDFRDVAGHTLPNQKQLQELYQAYLVNSACILLYGQ